MKRPRFACLTLLTVSATIATVLCAATTHAHYKSILIPEVAKGEAITTQSEANLRPMALAVRLPSGTILKPTALKVAKSLRSGQSDRHEYLTQSRRPEPTVLLERNGELTDFDEALESDNSRFDIWRC